MIKKISIIKITSLATASLAASPAPLSDKAFAIIAIVSACAAAFNTIAEASPSAYQVNNKYYY